MMKIFISIFALLLLIPAFAQWELDNNRLKTLINWQQDSSQGKAVLVAVLDSGINPDLPGIILPGWNFAEDNSDVMDDDGHGTASASVVWVLAPAVEILPIRVTKNGMARAQDLINGIVYAIDQGAEILNLSLTFRKNFFEQIKARLAPETFSRILFISAAGNGADFHPEVMAQNVLRVGATLLDYPITLANYSGHGPGVEIAAPAGGYADGITVFTHAGDNKYRLYNGTSAATPVVAAAAALLKAKNPKLNGAELKQLILRQAVSVEALKGKIKGGRLLHLNPAGLNL